LLVLVLYRGGGPGQRDRGGEGQPGDACHRDREDAGNQGTDDGAHDWHAIAVRWMVQAQ
jgi:hypothetical protein